jgi:hypothetical protein
VMTRMPTYAHAQSLRKSLEGKASETPLAALTRLPALDYIGSSSMSKRSTWKTITC